VLAKMGVLLSSVFSKGFKGYQWRK